ncbi:MAG TPA: GNAT family N-acetyltransferase [Salinibacter sp.]|nr:GNAT family N-acetyltransferase [Salinibacter sp.]
MAEIRVQTSGIEDLDGHVEISIAFLVESVLRPDPEGADLDLVECTVSEPWWKDYDVEPGADPAAWLQRFDTSTWSIISAWRGHERLGGVVILADDPAIDMLEGRADLGLIWDLRVQPSARGQGIGRRLIDAAEGWATSRGCSTLKVETQNINVPACRFYEQQGFVLRSVRAHAYPELPHELQLLWYKQIA